MFTLFRHRWDWLSLGAGFLLGLVFHYVLRLLQAGVRRLRRRWQQYRAARAATKEERVDQRYRQWLRATLQGWHLAAPLFALEEVLIPPEVLPPPRFTFPEDQDQSPLDDIVLSTVPFSPEWPHLQAFYQAPTLTLPQALAQGAHLLLLGPPGMGKTTALLYLALLMLQQDDSLGELAQHFPLYTHAAVLPLENQEEEPLLAPLLAALSAQMPANLRARWTKHLEGLLRAGRVVWLLDGLDELPLAAQEPVARYVERMLQTYPQMRVVAAAAPDFFDGLMRVGLQPVTLAPWDEKRAYRFLVQWGRQWRKHIAPSHQAAPPEVDALLLNRWLLAERPVVSPLELTLHAWAAYAGDTLGPRLSDGLEAYLRRMVPELERSRPALQAAALELLNLGQAVAPSKALGKHLDVEVSLEEDALEPDTEEGPAPEEQPSPEEKEHQGKNRAKAPVRALKVRRLLPELVQSGLLVEQAPGQVGFVHPSLWAYLAGEAIAQWPAEGVLVEPWWAVKVQALRFAAALGGGSDRVENWLAHSPEPLFREVRWLGHLLPDLPADSPMLPAIVRRLMDLLTDPLNPLGLRADALTALALSSERGLRVVFRKLLAHRDAGTRQLAALGCGLWRDEKAVPDLQALLTDEAPEVQRAAALALAAIGTVEALTALAELLLRGNDTQRRAAAEALANHPQEGHPILQDGAKHNDLLVRRAVAYGLARVGEPWAHELLEKMQVEDEEWVVQAAAAQVLEAQQHKASQAPSPRPALHDEPWLLAFAADHGMGVPPGDAAYEVLRQCLREGNEEQVLAALERVSFEPHKDWVAEIYALLYGGSTAQREAALLSLRYLAAAGAEMVNPMRYGLGRGMRG